MPFTHKGKRSILIWDGVESGIYEEQYKIDCPNCGSKEIYKAQDIKDSFQLPHELLEYLLQERIVTQGKAGYEVKKGIPTYVVEHQCESCNLKISIVLGLKETQPQRYSIFYKSSVYSKERI